MVWARLGAQLQGEDEGEVSAARLLVHRAGVEVQALRPPPVCSHRADGVHMNHGQRREQDLEEKQGDPGLQCHGKGAHHSNLSGMEAMRFGLQC